MEKVMLYIIGIFFLVGTIDYIFEGKYGLSKGIENGIKSMGSLALSMIGILSITPIISDLILKYILPIFKNIFVDPTILVSSFIAVDMGGYKIVQSISTDQGIIYFSGILISSILGCTISFTLPLALGIVKEKNIDILCKGILCGIVILPIGLFIGGILLKIKLPIILINLMPIVIISIFIVIGLYRKPNKMIIYFKYLAKFIMILGLVGLGLQGFTSITGVIIIENLLSLEETLTIVGKIAIFLAGANVMLEIIRMVFKEKIAMLEKILNINSASVAALIGSLASAVIVFSNFDKLDDRGKLVCSAFSVAGAYVFGGQLGYVVIEAKDITLIYILVKLISGFLGLALALKLSEKELRKTS
ncbi:ethanolamine utilization protein EutH [Clostridium sp.]|uniref:ethanolamine utilization protein EutH n=1 Tax=Clostridium sp. TaxID=1506 RepID=UPI0025B82724|nr:ethanolamine utilization protein EutH [Clostridium sp.]